MLLTSTKSRKLKHLEKERLEQLSGKQAQLQAGRWAVQCVQDDDFPPVTTDEPSRVRALRVIRVLEHQNIIRFLIFTTLS